MTATVTPDACALVDASSGGDPGSYPVGSAFYALDPDLRFLLVSPQAAELWHCPAESLVGQRFLDAFPGATGSDAFAAHLRAAESGRPVHLETRSWVLDRWIALSIYPGLAGLSVSFHDVSARRQAEAERQAAAESLQLTLDAAEMGSWDLDLLHGYARRSPRHDQIFGYADPVPEWDLATFLEHVLVEDREAAGTAFLAAMTPGGDLGFECRIKRAGDGEVRWIAVKGRTDFADYPAVAGPIPVRMVSVVRDVTASRQAQTLLRRSHEALEARVEERTHALADASDQLTREIEERERSEERFAAAFRLAPVPMMATLLEDLRILDVNEAFTGTLGHTAADARGRTMDDLRLWDRSSARRQFEQDLQAAGRVRTLDARLTTKTGWLLDCLVSAEIVTLQGQRCVLAVLQDITERKRSEAELFEAIEAVMQDTSWFSRTVIEKLAQLRHPERSQQTQADLADLTRREQEVLGLLCQGLNGEDMAGRLGLSRNTVRNHLATLYQKIGARGRSEAIIWARERGFTGPTGRAPAR
ncbi:MAG: PAS domain S-box protein [Pseudomonadota bacterium]|nr:PAS domain S-box protein [Pseudomonadota bacterium]